MLETFRVIMSTEVIDEMDFFFMQTLIFSGARAFSIMLNHSMHNNAGAH